MSYRLDSARADGPTQAHIYTTPVTNRTANRVYGTANEYTNGAVN